MPCNQPEQTVPELPVYSYQFRYACDRPLKLPHYPGSAWRGALGHALKKTVCIVRNTPCAACLLKTSCAYAYVFETPPPQNAKKMRKYTASPHPFILQFPAPDASQAETYQINLVLFGQGQRFFPYLVHAMKQAGQDGIGSSHQPFILEQVTQSGLDGKPVVIYQEGQLRAQATAVPYRIPSLPDTLEFRIHTPMRIKQNGHHLTPETFNFGALFGNLLRRISMLTYFHTATPLETRFAELTQQARQVAFTEKNLSWFDWKRYSSRQQTEMNMGGVIGTASLDMRGLDAFWPYLWLGQWTHAGKATSMGLGQYTLTATSLSDTD